MKLLDIPASVLEANPNFKLTETFEGLRPQLIPVLRMAVMKERYNYLQSVLVKEGIKAPLCTPETYFKFFRMIEEANK
ncbi:hypothetical protein ACNO7T_15740 [Vibrio campbellii]